MDVKIEDGAITKNEHGLPVTVSGTAALLQRARIRLCMIRGSFVYNRTLGSRIPQMDRTGAHAAEQACGFAREALVGCPSVSVVSATVTDGAVTVLVDCAGERESIAVAAAPTGGNHGI